MADQQVKKDFLDKFLTNKSVWVAAIIIPGGLSVIAAAAAYKYISKKYRDEKKTDG